MTQYIDKSALVAEAERRLDELYNLLPNASKVENGMITISEACNTGKYTALESFKGYIDTLDVKEVDLDFKIKEDWLLSDKTEVDCLECMCLTEDMFVYLAKKYFALGLKAQKGEEV